MRPAISPSPRKTLEAPMVSEDELDCGMIILEQAPRPWRWGGRRLMVAEESDWDD